jgi:hypothetical protein
MFSQKKSICYFVESSYLNFIFKISVAHYLIIVRNHLELYLEENKHSIYCGRK